MKDLFGGRFVLPLFLWTFTGYGFISRRKHGHDHAA